MIDEIHVVTNGSNLMNGVTLSAKFKRNQFRHVLRSLRSLRRPNKLRMRNAGL